MLIREDFRDGESKTKCGFCGEEAKILWASRTFLHGNIIFCKISAIVHCKKCGWQNNADMCGNLSLDGTEKGLLDENGNLPIQMYIDRTFKFIKDMCSCVEKGMKQ